MGLVETKLGKRVAAQRRVARLTQAQLAERAGVAVETISRLERGAAMPSLSRIEDIGKALGVALCELFRFSERARGADLGPLLSLLANRSPEEVQLVTDVATRILAGPQGAPARRPRRAPRA